MLNARALCAGLMAILLGFCLHISSPPGIIEAQAQYSSEPGFGGMGLRGGGLDSSASSDGVRPSMGKLLQLANELIKQQKFQEALVRIQQADDTTRARMSDKIPIGRSSYEEYALQRTRAIAAMGAGDLPLAVRSFEAVIATGRLPTKDRINLIESVVSLYYQDKDYGNALQWGQRYLAEGGTSTKVHTLMANSYYLTGDFAAARDEISALLAANEKSGQAPTQEQLNMLADSCLKLNDNNAVCKRSKN